VSYTPGISGCAFDQCWFGVQVLYVHPAFGFAQHLLDVTGAVFLDAAVSLKPLTYL